MVVTLRGQVGNRRVARDRRRLVDAVRERPRSRAGTEEIGAGRIGHAGGRESPAALRALVAHAAMPITQRPNAREGQIERQPFPPMHDFALSQFIIRAQHLDMAADRFVDDHLAGREKTGRGIGERVGLQNGQRHGGEPVQVAPEH